MILFKFDRQETISLIRYVPSRLSDHPPSVAGATIPAPTGETFLDSLDFELDILGATNTRPTIPYRAKADLLQESRPPAALTQLPDPVIQSPIENLRR